MKDVTNTIHKKEQMLREVLSSNKIKEQTLTKEIEALDVKGVKLEKIKSKLQVLTKELDNVRLLIQKHGSELEELKGEKERRFKEIIVTGLKDKLFEKKINAVLNIFIRNRIDKQSHLFKTGRMTIIEMPIQ